MCVLTVVVFGLMLTGCPQPTEEVQLPPDDIGEAELTAQADAASEVTPPEGEPYKIGAIFDTSGVASALGQPEADTAEMIEEMINAAGGINGRPLKIIIRDTKEIGRASCRERV